MIEPKRILLSKIKHIGDIVLAIPAAHALHTQWPEAKIDVIVNRHCACLFEDFPWIHHVYESPKRSSFGERLKAELKLCKDIFTGGYDLFIDLAGGDRAMWYALLSRARDRWCTDVSDGAAIKPWVYNGRSLPIEPHMHTIEHEAAFLEANGVKVPPFEPRFPRPQESVQRVDAWLTEYLIEAQRMVVVHPTSRWLFKCWEDERMAALCDHLDASGFQVVMTCGPDKRELERAKRVLGHMKSKAATRLGDLSLTELAELIRRARFFVGVDTAPAHMASAVGTPSLVLFGPSFINRWRPYGENQGYVASPCHCLATVGDVACDKSQTMECMHKLSYDQVIQTLEDKLHKTSC